MAATGLSLDTEAVLLLCGHFDQSQDDLQPLSTGEYNRLARWLDDQGLRPPALIDTFDSLDGFEETALDRERVGKLLARGPALAFTVEQWLNHGLWVISRADPGYPRRYLERLKALTPPMLYGAGDQSLLGDRGLAVIGSRNVDESGLAFASAVAQTASRDRVTIVSGGARGVDQVATSAALEAGGTAAGILANSLNRAAVSGAYRDAIRDQRLVLLSPYSPNAGFSVGNAMGRNKLIHALADWSLVVDCSVESGGTWAGATENLNKCWTPLFVRAGHDAPDGNRCLLAEGGIALDLATIEEAADLAETLNHLVRHSSPAPAAKPTQRALDL